MCKNCDWQDWDKQAEKLLDRLEELPERASDFATSVEEKVKSMRDWVNDKQHVTQPIRESLDNMAKGAERWLDRD